MAVFDREDQQEFAEELRQAMVLSTSLGDDEPGQSVSEAAGTSTSTLADLAYLEFLMALFTFHDNLL